MSISCYDQWMSIAPELWLLGAAVLVLLLGRSGAGKDGESLGYFSVLGMAGALGCVLLELEAAVRRPLAGLMILDGCAGFFSVVILTAAMLVTLMAAQPIRGGDGAGGGKRHFLQLLSVVGMLVMVKGLDLLVIALGLAIGVAVNCFLARPETLPEVEPPTRGNHLRLGMLSLGSFLLGVLVLSHVTGTTNLEEIGAVLAANTLPGDPLLLQGMILLLVGLGIPLAFVPFHGWVLRLAHDASPALIAWLDVAFKAAGMAVIARMLGKAPAFAGQWDPVLCGLAIASMSLGNLAALAETNLARMLTYSGIAHAGYLLVGVIAGGILGWSAVLFYLVTYGFMSLGALAMVLWLGEQRRSRLELEELAGLGVRCPALGAALGIFMLSLAGIPPLSGFMGKLFVLHAAVESNHLWLAGIAAVNCLISASYYLRVALVMYTQDPLEEQRQVSEGPVLIVVVITLAATLQAGIFPGPLLEWALGSLGGLIG